MLRAEEVFSDDPNSEDPKHKSPSKASPSKEGVKEKLYVPSKLEINLIRLSRNNVEKMIDMPCFATIAIGCFIKIGLGQNGNEENYVATQILDVCETANVYMVGRTRTNKGFIVRIGNEYTVFRFDIVSNQETNDSEYHQWLKANIVAKQPFPTKQLVKQK